VAQARALEELVVLQDLVPEVLDRLHLGEEPVAADVEAPPVPLDGAADAPHHVVALEHRRHDARLRELVRGREAGGPGADDDDVWLSTLGRVLALVGRRWHVVVLP
jgi:hypothetical protein